MRAECRPTSPRDFFEQLTPMTRPPRPIELLAPARNAEIAIEAIKHGADAVYIGPPHNGARAAAANSIEELAAVADFAHKYNARVYATVNTIIYNDELRRVERMIRDLYRAGIDAVIVQDMAVLRMDIPPIALHASTQCDIRTPEKARFLEAAGFSQIVPARELTLDETERICKAVSVPVEVFVHGALCVSYSGDCYASLAATGRSANRGECAQLCRMPYTLTDKHGNILLENRHLLSLRDLNRSGALADLLAAGVSSFKIEGRLKDAAYVKNVVAAYRMALDSIIDSNPELYTRSSSGRCDYSFTPDLNKSFNRGYTSYFTKSEAPSTPMASFASPKWIGEKIGTVKACRHNYIELDTRKKLTNGDGMGYFDTNDRFIGFRVNRAEGTRVFPATKTTIPAGTPIYRNSDKAWTDMIGGQTAIRLIDIAMTLRATPSGIALDIQDTDGCKATVSVDGDFQTARTTQHERRKETLEKTGYTCFKVSAIDDTAGNIFIPASVLTGLRRDSIAALERSRALHHRYTYRNKAPEAPELPTGTTLTYRDNVANTLAIDFYTEAGATASEPALECNPQSISDGTIVMNTRYCLRRECGKCLRTAEGRQWQGPLSISNDNYAFRLEFDCKQCRMLVKTSFPRR